jgi:predicted AlkP superfamily pyrophosphatase or phosphodiesterase
MEKIKIITTLIAGLYFTTGEAQSLPAVPRLVVNITIDQLRTDYMEAFSPLYGSGGFKKLFENSRVYTQAQYPSSRLDRASAVATVSTGATPYDNGIVGIQWLDRETLRPVMAVDDNDCEGVMTLDKYSPRRLAVSTIGR